MGLTSDVIAGINWAVANREPTTSGSSVLRWDIRHRTVHDRSALQAVARATEAASSCRLLRQLRADEHRGSVLGGITSPGNSPLALQSARWIRWEPSTRRRPRRRLQLARPTPSSSRESGRRRSGTRLVSLEAPRSYLATNYPQWPSRQRHHAYRVERQQHVHRRRRRRRRVAADNIRDDTRAGPDGGAMGASFVEDGGSSAAARRGQLLGVDAHRDTRVSTLLRTVDNLLGTSSGATYRDNGR